MRCSKCGAENPEGKRFCGNCGAVLGNRCPQCGADNALGKRFAVIAAPQSLAALHS
jgi:predicted amidophosphoribosyltransferase